MSKKTKKLPLSRRICKNITTYSKEYQGNLIMITNIVVTLIIAVVFGVLQFIGHNYLANYYQKFIVSRNMWSFNLLVATILVILVLWMIHRYYKSRLCPCEFFYPMKTWLHSIFIKIFIKPKYQKLMEIIVHKTTPISFGLRNNRWNYKNAKIGKKVNEKLAQLAYQYIEQTKKADNKLSKQCSQKLKFNFWKTWELANDLNISVFSNRKIATEYHKWYKVEKELGIEKCEECKEKFQAFWTPDYNEYQFQGLINLEDFMLNHSIHLLDKFIIACDKILPGEDAHQIIAHQVFQGFNFEKIMKPEWKEGIKFAKELNAVMNEHEKLVHLLQKTKLWGKITENSYWIKTFRRFLELGHFEKKYKNAMWGQKSNIERPWLKNTLNSNSEATNIFFGKNGHYDQKAIDQFFYKYFNVGKGILADKRYYLSQEVKS
ncbi:hypothetical protein K8R66_02840 [bacterium]|nr:hypothetical protein [bacterium]